MIISKGLSATLDNLYQPPAIMTKCAQWRKVVDEEFYEMWNGGQGMLLIIDEKDVALCVSRAKEFGLEAQLCGEITLTESPTVTVHSRLSDCTITYT